MNSEIFDESASAIVKRATSNGLLSMWPRKIECVTPHKGHICISYTDMASCQCQGLPVAPGRGCLRFG
mgnify:CR=1 FL=1